MSDRITFKCTDCGQPVTIDNDKPPEDSDLIVCGGCGRTFGTYAEVKKAMIELGKKAVDEMLDKANLPPWISRTWKDDGNP